MPHNVSHGGSRWPAEMRQNPLRRVRRVSLRPLASRERFDAKGFQEGIQVRPTYLFPSLPKFQKCLIRCHGEYMLDTTDDVVNNNCSLYATIVCRHTFCMRGVV